MAFQRELLRIRFRFIITGTDEIADTGLYLSLPGAGTFDAQEALANLDDANLDAMFSAYMAMMDGSNGWAWAAFSRLVAVRASAVDQAGKEIGDPKEKAYTTSNAGTDARTIPQATSVLSFNSGTRVGTANFGRMYLPHTMPALQSGQPFVPAVSTDAQVSSGATFLDAIEAAAAGLPDPPVVVIASSLGTGTNKAVAEVRVGNVVDTQRRRRNRLPETYQVQVRV